MGDPTTRLAPGEFWRASFTPAGPATLRISWDPASAENDTIDELMEMMTLGRFRHVPVLDGDNRLCGIVSIGDVVKARIDETVREAADLRQYIAAAG